MVISKKTIIFEDSKRDQTFSRVGVQLLISIETYTFRTCDYAGGSGPPGPLWIRAW